MTLNELVKKVKQYTHRGDKTVTTDTITQDIIEAINDARRDAIKRVPKRWFHVKAATPLSVVQGTTDYALAADVQEPIIFRYTDANALHLPVKIDSDREWFSKVFDPTSSQDNPVFYREIGPDSSENKQVEFFPTPDKAYTVNYEYYSTPSGTELTTSDLSTEIADIPDYCHDVLWKGGMFYFYSGFDDPAQVKAETVFKEALDLMDRSDERDEDSEIAFRFGNLPQSTLADPVRFKL